MKRDLKVRWIRSRKGHINENLLAGGIGGIDPTAGPASYNVQGPAPGYIYNVRPLNNDLQQKANKVDNSFYIYPGCTVRGYGLYNRDKRYTGQVYRIVKGGDGSILHLFIKTIKTNRFVPVVADGLELINYSKKISDKKGKYFP